MEGSLETRTYEKDGQTHYMTEIKVWSFQFLDNKEKDGRQQIPHRQQSAQGGDDDIPF